MIICNLKIWSVSDEDLIDVWRMDIDFRENLFYQQIMPSTHRASYRVEAGCIGFSS
jgi:hypothetical protein